MIERGILEFPHYGYVEAYLYGLSFPQLEAQRIEWETQRLRDLAETVPQEDTELPF